MRIFMMFFLLLFPYLAVADGIETKLLDPAEEARAQTLFKELRCMVCAGESIHDSNADLAKDLRQLVRKRIESGDTDAAVLAYIASRYGDTILMKPPVTHSTYLLWFGPLVFLVIGVMVLAINRKR